MSEKEPTPANVRQRGVEAIDFTVGGKTVHMQIGEVKAGTAALTIEAPRGVDIVREELIEQRRLTRAAATEQE